MCSSDLPTEENLLVTAYRAYQALRPNIPALSVSLEKHIPVQAGLGGGSSDAAAMLTYLNQNTPEPLAETALLELATALGADVPFFLLNASAKAEGIGERLTRLPQLPAWPVLLLKPRQWGVSTQEAFEALSASNRQAKPWPTQLDRLESGMPLLVEDVYLCQHNDFEAPLRQASLQLDTAFTQLEALGLRPVLSGSGPTIVCILPEVPSSGLKSQLSEVFVSEFWWMTWTNLS